MTDPKPPDKPPIVNLHTPLPHYSIMTPKGPVEVDMREVAKRVPDAAAGAIISIGAFKNAKGEWEPDYDSVMVEGEEL